MEILGTISTVDSLSGSIISLVKSLVIEVNRARKDVTNLPAEVENLEKQYQKLSDRVTQGQQANAKLPEVLAANSKLGKFQIKKGELEELLERVEISLQKDLVQLNSFKKEDPKRRWKKILWALIGKGANKVHKQIKEIVRRIEEDCKQLNEAFNVRSFAGGIRLEAAVGRLEASVDQATEGVVQVKEILTERLPMIRDSQSQVLPEYPVAMKERASSLEETVNSLKDGEIVGIFGMGGIGKTTLAKQVFNNICEKFMYTCFVDDVKGIQLRELENEILKEFQERGGTASCRSWTHLKNKKVLIVMDNIDRHEQLASVFSRRLDFEKGSVVMFTTRNSHLCKRRHMISFEVPFLELHDARKLLCKHAFGEEDIPERLRADMSKYVKEVVNKCDGLPLSLEVIGRHLYDEDAKEWEATILKLSGAQPLDGAREDSLFEILKVSYDALAEEEKQMFCDIATFFVGERLDFTLAAMSSSCIDPRSCWGNLVRRCLVKDKTKLLSTYSNGSHAEHQEVWMHGHLQDLGMGLARTSFLSGADEAADNVIEEINSYKEETNKLRSVSISNPSDETALLMSSLAQVTELKYLRLLGGRHQGSSKDFPGGLALLQWAGKYDDDLSSRLHVMKNLAVLELDDRSCETADLTPFRLPDSFSGLKKLKILKLTSRRIQDFPESFGRLSSLEVLVLKYLGVTHLPDSFGDLTCIKTIVFKKCNKLTQLPNSFGNLSSLRSLVIDSCIKLKQLPPSFSNLSGLRILDCFGTQLVEFGDSFQNSSMLQNLQVLRLECLNANPPPSFSQLSPKTLQYLRLKLRHEVPEGHSDIVSWDLSSLQGLTSQAKELITALSKDLGRRMLGDRVDLQFSLDKVLVGTSPQNLAIESIQVWRRRRVPILSQRPGVLGLPEVQTVPKSIGKLSLLENLEISGDDLSKVPDYIPGFRLLKALRVRSSCYLETLPNSVGQLGSLKDLTIENCPKLKTLPESLEQLGVLEKLTILKCGELLTVGECIEQLGSLKDLQISDCAKLKTVIPERLKKLGSLEKLTASRCGELLTMGESIGQLGSLKDLRILDCPKLKTLPESIGQLSSLEKLILQGCDELLTLPESIGQLGALKDLKISFCLKLETLPKGLGQLGSLEKLTVQGCDELLTLPERLGQLGSLKGLHILDCPKLKTS